MANVEKDVLDIIAKQANLDRGKLNRDAKMAELDIQSLDVVEIIFAIEEKFDITVPYNANDPSGVAAGVSFNTIGDVVDAVQNLVNEQAAAKSA
ncbi:MAG TPA: phosphopantetheine-binding protein [Alphaproteobacteria bacterium]|nr:phosphopantetheine-binding protein [Alphaproteobacteria bacterium]